MTSTQRTYAAIKQFLQDNANAIQQRATQHHKDFIGGEHFRSEFIAKYQANHIEIVKQLAAHLEQNNIHEGLAVFTRLGETVARDSVNDDLTIEEAVDGIIFLKQALWEKTKETGLINQLTVEEFYHISQIVGIYIDVVSSKIAFTYHNYYKQKIASELSKRQQLETQRNEFISMVGHELKTPVTSLKAFAHVLERRFAKAGDDTSALHLKRMGRQVTKLTALIGDLLDVTRIDGGRLHFHNDYFAFDELVDEVVRDMQHVTDRQTIITEGRTGETIYGDRDRIGQVLTNLLTNAIKYAPHSDRIVVTLTSDGENVSCSVHDFGIGIAKDAQAHIFERFYRETGQKGGTFPGLGLGLYLAREITHEQGGRIWVESEPGSGSIFYFSLPIADSSKIQQQSTTREEEMKHEYSS